MNCDRFQKRLLDYVDDTLDPRLRAQVEAHVVGCEACRKALQQHRDLARLLSARLENSVSRVVLSPSTKFRLARELRNPPKLETSLVGNQSGGRHILWLGGIVAAAVMALCAAIELPLVRHGHPSEATQPDAGRPGTVSIYIADCVPVRSFERKGGVTVDTLNCESCVVEDVY